MMDENPGKLMRYFGEDLQVPDGTIKNVFHQHLEYKSYLPLRRGPMESMEEDPMSSNKIRLRPIKLSKPRIGWIAENFHHQVDKHFHSTKPSPMEAIAGAMEDMNKDHLIKAWDGFRS
ncbi:unnamed protein product [Hymenolepis diminuta]|uniref:Uncharacterized protein n=1 Tax=Hymenolepis diminuta TaxID=6216 RepID=A0A564YMU9_HYMDI|nr:unnamed protein product [Hymenolepis diminuta]